MDAADLVRDIKKIRQRGALRTRFEDAPAVYAALTRFRPSTGVELRPADLREFLADSLDLMEDRKFAEALGPALGMDDMGRGSADRRADFAAVFDLSAETVRRADGLENQAFELLAQTIVYLVEGSPRTPSVEPPVKSDEDVGATPSLPISSGPTLGTSPQRITVNVPQDVGTTYQRRAFDDEIDMLWASGGDRRIWLRGGPGVGKSYTARRIVQESLSIGGRGADQLVIWVDSAKEESIAEAFSKAMDLLAGATAGQVSRDQMMAKARKLHSTLTASDWRWLVVFDNANPKSLLDSGLMPTGKSPNGRVLVTTLGSDIRMSDHGKIVTAGVFSADEADSFLLRQVDSRTGGPAETALANDSRRHSLAQTLNFHPLAVSIASATIIANAMTIPEWICEFEEVDRMDHAADSPDRGGYPHLISHTWQIALEKAAEGLPPGVARRAALVGAVLDPDGYPTWLWDHEALTSWVGNGEKLARRHGRPVVMQALEEYGVTEFVGRNWASGRLTMHQLAARAIRESAQSAELSELVDILTEAFLIRVTERKVEPASEFRRHLEVVLALTAISERSATTCRALLVYFHSGRGRELEVAAQRLEAQASVVEDVGGTTARAYFAQGFADNAIKREEGGDYEQAAPLWTRASELYEACLSDPNATPYERASWLFSIATAQDHLHNRAAASAAWEQSAQFITEALGSDVSVSERITLVSRIAELGEEIPDIPALRQALKETVEVAEELDLAVPEPEDLPDEDSLAETALSYMESGRFLHLAHHSLSAMRHLDHAAQLYKQAESAEEQAALLELARVQVFDEAWDQAEDTLTTLISVAPDHSEAGVLRASVRARKGSGYTLDLVPAEEKWLEKQRERELMNSVDSTLLVELGKHDAHTALLRELADTAYSSGRLSEHADFESMALEELRSRSEDEPGTIEDQLLSAYQSTQSAMVQAERWADAIKIGEQAKQLALTLNALDPDEANSLMAATLISFLLGRAHAEEGNCQEAETAYTESLANAEQVPVTDAEYESVRLLSAAALERLGDVLGEQERYKEAEDAYTQALAIDPNNTDVLLDLGDVLQEQERYPEAETAYTQALQHAQQALAINPDSEFAHLVATRVLLKFGAALEALERYQEATQQMLAVNLDSELAHLLASTSALEGLGAAIKAQERYQESETTYTQALQHTQQVLDINPDSEFAHLLTASALRELSDVLQAQERHQEAETTYTQALQHTQQVLAINPDSEFAHDFAAVRGTEEIGAAIKAQERYQEAETAYTQARQRTQQALAIIPDSEGAHIVAATRGLQELGAALEGQERYPEAETTYIQARQHAQQMLAINPDSEGAHIVATRILQGLGAVLQAQERYPEAETTYTQALQHTQQALAINPDSEYARRLATSALQELGDVLQAQERYPEAETTYTQALQHTRKILILNPENDRVQTLHDDLADELHSLQLRDATDQ